MFQALKFKGKAALYLGLFVLPLTASADHRGGRPEGGYDRAQVTVTDRQYTVNGRGNGYHGGNDWHGHHGDHHPHDHYYYSNHYYYSAPMAYPSAYYYDPYYSGDPYANYGYGYPYANYYYGQPYAGPSAGVYFQFGG